MTTWGDRPFVNDSAAGFLADLGDSSSRRGEIQRLFSQVEEEHAAAYIDADTGSGAWTFTERLAIDARARMVRSAVAVRLRSIGGPVQCRRRRHQLPMSEARPCAASE